MDGLPLGRGDGDHLLGREEQRGQDALGGERRLEGEVRPSAGPGRHRQRREGVEVASGVLRKRRRGRQAQGLIVAGFNCSGEHLHGKQRRCRTQGSWHKIREGGRSGRGGALRLRTQVKDRMADAKTASVPPRRWRMSNFGLLMSAFSTPVVRIAMS